MMRAETIRHQENEITYLRAVQTAMLCDWPVVSDIVYMAI